MTAATIDTKSTPEGLELFAGRRTRSGLPILDPAPLIAEGRKQVRDELADALRSVEQAKDAGALEAAWRFVASEASRIAKATDAEVEPLRKRRDEAMLSLYLLDRVRGVDQAAGIAATTFYEMRQKALAAEEEWEDAGKKGPSPIPRIEDARDVIAEVAPRVLVLNGRREEASDRQKQAALALDDLGVPVQDIIQIVDLSEGRFWQWHAGKQRPETRQARRRVRAQRSAPLWEALDAEKLRGSRRKLAGIGLPQAVMEALWGAGIRNVGDLVACSENDLRQVPRVGEAAIRRIEAAVTRAAA